MPAIFLIGFMGSGKTTLGKKLAAHLHYEFIDLDRRMEKKEGVSIAEVFSSKGESYFRNEEKKYLQSIVTDGNAIIATGGGTPCFYDNMQWMNDHGITLYLQVSPEILRKRLDRKKNNRPLIKDEVSLLDFIKSKLQERETYYEQATLTVHADEINTSQLIKALQPYLLHS